MGIWDVEMPEVDCGGPEDAWSNSAPWLQECAWMPKSNIMTHDMFKEKIENAAKEDFDEHGARYHWPIPCSRAMEIVFYALDDDLDKCDEITTYNGTLIRACKTLLAADSPTGQDSVLPYYQQTDYGCRSN